MIGVVLVVGDPNECETEPTVWTVSDQTLEILSLGSNISEPPPPPPPLHPYAPPVTLIIAHIPGQLECKLYDHLQLSAADTLRNISGTTAAVLMDSEGTDAFAPKTSPPDLVPSHKSQVLLGTLGPLHGPPVTRKGSKKESFGADNEG